MPPQKKKLSFSDLGLDIALPSVLSKSKNERKNEQLEKKRAKKEREKEALEVVAASREVVEKRKRDVEEENALFQKEKEQRKKLSRIEHIKSRNEREQKEREQKHEALVSQSVVIAKIKEDWENEEKERKEIAALIEEERERAAASAPRNVHIIINRTEDIIQQRSDLPVVREEQPIMEAINDSQRSCVLISGETGSGKTTQIPQFLWEAGYGHPEGEVFGRDGRILVTEPRRVAAVSMARRVAAELNVGFGDEVCYHVRYDNNMSQNCKIKFATEGVVLKEIQSDFLLKQYSVIIVDEAHERSISCDILVGLLSRIMPLRNDLFAEQLRDNNGDMTKVKVKPLKLVIMSATLHISDFRDNRKLFPIPPPLIQVDARRFPVANHFARKTELREYVTEAFKKVRQIHKKLPPGGILVFLTTQQEIEDLCEQLRRHYQRNKIEYSSESYSKHALLLGHEREEASESDTEIAASEGGSGAGQATLAERDEFGLEVDDYALEDAEDDGGTGGRRGKRSRRAAEGSEEAVEEVVQQLQARGHGGGGGETSIQRRGADSSSGTRDDESMGDMRDDEVNGEYNTLHVLPLYALLDFQQQQEVFKDPPRGKRLCVVATNVAETSLTIPNIKYVVDAGRAKVKLMEEGTKASCYRIDWISQASAEQRSGRAGRMGPGHCYRLYSTAVYANLMPKHTTPEILRTPLDTVVLLMKQVGIQHVGSFPFPSCPKESEVWDAMHHLHAIGALDASHDYRITPLGRQLVAFPVPPRFARALAEVVARQLPPRMVEVVCAVVASISTSSNVFTAEGNRIKSTKKELCKDDPRALAIKSLLNPGSDLVTSLNAFAAFYARPQQCRFLCMVEKSMQEAKMLFHQIRAMLLREMNIPKIKSDNAVHTTAEEADEVADTMDEGEKDATGGGSTRPVEKSCFLQDYRDENGMLTAFTLERSEELQLRRLFIPGLIDQVARRATVHECRTLGVEYVDKRTSRAPYLLLKAKTIAYVHPTSSIARTFPPPEYVTFSFLQKVRRSDQERGQTALMEGVTIVTKEWLDEYNFFSEEEE